jgi:hypothetical protein
MDTDTISVLKNFIIWKRLKNTILVLELLGDMQRKCFGQIGFHKGLMKLKLAAYLQ